MKESILSAWIWYLLRHPGEVLDPFPRRQDGLIYAYGWTA